MEEAAVVGAAVVVDEEEGEEDVEEHPRLATGQIHSLNLSENCLWVVWVTKLQMMD